MTYWSASGAVVGAFAGFFFSILFVFVRKVRDDGSTDYGDNRIIVYALVGLIIGGVIGGLLVGEGQGTVQTTPPPPTSVQTPTQHAAAPPRPTSTQSCRFPPCGQTANPNIP